MHEGQGMQQAVLLEHINSSPQHKLDVLQSNWNSARVILES
jgi:hypothetical protein